jgi:hypothetical protein
MAPGERPVFAAAPEKRGGRHTECACYLVGTRRVPFAARQTRFDGIVSAGLKLCVAARLAFA